MALQSSLRSASRPLTSISNSQSHIVPIITHYQSSSRTPERCQGRCHNFQPHRSLHSSLRSPAPPSPTPFVPDALTFLTLIGRGLSQYADKIPSWDALFNLKSSQLKDLGIEPARNRKYLLRWREKFRKGEWGVGGDLPVVSTGSREGEGEGVSGLGRATLRVVEVPAKDVSLHGRTFSPHAASLTHSPNTTLRVVNVSEASPLASAVSPVLPTPDARTAAVKAVNDLGGDRIAHMQIHASSRVKGPYLEPLKGTNGSVAVLRVREGLWEHRRGQKLDGGERRRAEVRAKKRAAARRAAA